MRHAEEGIPGVSRSAVLSHTDSSNPLNIAPHTDWEFRDWPSEHVTESRARRSVSRNHTTIRALLKTHDLLWGKQRLGWLSTRNLMLPLLLLCCCCCCCCTFCPAVDPKRRMRRAAMPETHHTGAVLYLGWPQFLSASIKFWRCGGSGTIIKAYNLQC